MPNPYHRETFSLALRLTALSLLTCACSGDVVNLGGIASDLTASSSLCQSSTSVEGGLTVETQAELEQLVGCEEVRGNLFVRPFEGPDFRPLASLRTVRGTLALGRLSALDYLELPPEEQATEVFQVTFERENTIIEGGWLSSFEGLEGLERVGSLVLLGVSAPSLAAFSNLGALTDRRSLQIASCTNLRDLTGLEGVAGVIDLTVNCNSLESLAGLPFPPRMVDVILIGSQLADLGEFDVEVVNDLRIESTALESLDGLSSLTNAASILVYGNSALTDMDGLNRVNFADELSVQKNDRLQQLPDFTALIRLDSLSVAYNEALTSLGSFPNLSSSLERFPGSDSADLSDFAPQEALNYRPDLIEISYNPVLQHVSLPAGWLGASYVMIDANDQLESLHLSGLRAIDSLSIAGNTVLQSVELGNLATVDDLRVIGNPLLPLSDFDGLRTFERLLSTEPFVDDDEP